MERIEPSNIRIQQTHQFADVVELPSASEARVNQTEAYPIERRRAPPQAPKANGGMSLSLAGVFSVFWAGGLAAYLIGFLGLEGLQQISPPWWGLIGAVAIVPVALTWIAAYLLREARILRQHSATLATAAASLLEPEEHAAKGLTRLDLKAAGIRLKSLPENVTDLAIGSYATEINWEILELWE